MIQRDSAINYLAWSNIALRLLVVLGAVFLVGAKYSAEDVSAWLKLVTFFAAINTFDGMMSQYFVRVFISKKNDASNYLSFQVVVYFFSAAVFLAVYSSVFEVDVLALACVGFFCIIKVYDARAKAELPVHVVQVVELAASSVVFLFVYCALVYGDSYGVVAASYVFSLALGAALKTFLYARNHGFRSARFFYRSGRWLCERELFSDLIRVVFVSSSGALLINVALLYVSESIQGGGAELLLSYRLMMLACEIFSVPLISRMPEVTRRLAAGEHDAAIFIYKKNRNISLFFLALAFLFFSAIGGWAVSFVSQGKVAISVAPILILGCLGWYAERVMMFYVQLRISMLQFEVYRAFLIYPIVFLIIVLMACHFASQYFFVTAILLNNIFHLYLVKRF